MLIKTPWFIDGQHTRVEEIPLTDLSLCRGSVVFGSIAMFTVEMNGKSESNQCRRLPDSCRWADQMREIAGTRENLILMTSIVYRIVSASAQTSSPQEAPAFSPAKSIGMFAYPKNQQNADQQLKDESQCYGSAKQHTSFDPQSAAPQQPNAEQSASTATAGGTTSW